ncbi:MAG: cytochrome C [Gammaproteobacteria bacterium]|nr:cytochrome C [Gammaproteobacteria bacterium]NNJ50834.1 cytochrome C [Gammaproteobacteria bacterium]
MQHNHFLLVRVILSSLIMMASPVLFADSLQSLLMPGPLISAHEKYEEECDQCHDTSNKERQGQLCMQCHEHENILEDINNKSGFHGRLAEKYSNNCKHCHTDHKGRNAKIVLLNASTFDHLNTDFPLKGAHAKATCKACHEPEEKFSQAPSDCYSCHKSSDVHKGKQGKKCDSCHQASDWKKTAFDHEKTDFPLTGRHEKTRCAACHIDQKYKDTPTACSSCHQIDDIHGGSFGKKCNTCHDTEKWEKTRFDHDKKTEFPLLGNHKKASCNSCHVSGDVNQELPKKCYGCHKNDDSHKGRYGKKCKSCHTPAAWQKQTFDHSKKTDFPLSGIHKKTSCNQCHKGDLYEDELKARCIDCHKKDDVHKGNQGSNCDSCHNEKGWNDRVLFDHDLTRFPLIGMHAVAQCEECHLSENYGETDSDCNLCHAADDVHEMKLGTRCADCHNPNSWGTWLFDHNKTTDFDIDGAHKKLGCYDCHQTATKGKVKATKDCIACHRSRDIHNRQFGRHCGDCHTTKSFKEISIKR